MFAPLFNHSRGTNQTNTCSHRSSSQRDSLADLRAFHHVTFIDIGREAGDRRITLKPRELVDNLVNCAQCWRSPESPNRIEHNINLFSHLSISTVAPYLDEHLALGGKFVASSNLQGSFLNAPVPLSPEAKITLTLLLSLATTSCRPLLRKFECNAVSAEEPIHAIVAPNLAYFTYCPHDEDLSPARKLNRREGYDAEDICSAFPSVHHIDLAQDAIISVFRREGDLNAIYWPNLESFTLYLPALWMDHCGNPNAFPSLTVHRPMSVQFTTSSDAIGDDFSQPTLKFTNHVPTRHYQGLSPIRKRSSVISPGPPASNISNPDTTMSDFDEKKAPSKSGNDLTGANYHACATSLMVADGSRVVLKRYTIHHRELKPHCPLLSPTQYKTLVVHMVVEKCARSNYHLFPHQTGPKTLAYAIHYIMEVEGHLSVQLGGPDVLFLSDSFVRDVHIATTYRVFMMPPSIIRGYHRVLKHDNE
ncbi:hypothetical protein V8B97DRAFT_2108624 [Scleroderma yunnanense]